MTDKLRKILFYAVVIVNYIMVTIYEFMTPHMTDDIIYSDVVAEANSFFDLFVQEYEHYMNHIGRSLAHIILRIFLYIGNKGVFNIVAGGVFIALSLLVYANIDFKKKYDLRVYIGILILFWLFEPAISNTVFWETGACNYLFTATIMFGYITLFRKFYKEGKQGTLGAVIGMFFFGLAAGWCNENSSGGVILLVLILIAAKRIKDGDFGGVRPWMLSGLIGNLAGFMIMILSPGNTSRSESTEEAHSGLTAIAARFLKITMNIKEYYLVLVLVFAVILIAIVYRVGQRVQFYEAAGTMILFGVLFLATSYALIAVPDSQLRTYYCASLFLMTGIINGFSWIVNEGFKEDIMQIIGTSLVVVLSVVFIFTYVEQGANLARIKREFDERDAYFLEKSKGVEDELVIQAPMLRPDWKSRYSMAYDSDISEDKDNWINASYASHYGLWFIFGVDRENWTEY